ncbi:MAG: hypothetical protein IT287_08755 [Bdellovibrionaceae bacterium]|nr:hypothetical protein [Pseudobdellovibrionaceae bacterium]
MKTVFFALMLVTQVSFADIIKCQFTEPFAKLEYSTTQSKIKITKPKPSGVGVNITYITAAYLQFMGPNHIVVQKNNNTVLDLVIDNLGSDAMSSAVYPYSAHWFFPGVVPGGHVGGCTSNFLPYIVAP